MSVADSETVARDLVAEPMPRAARAWPARLRRLRPDLLVLAGYLAMGGYLLIHMWWDIDNRMLAHSYNDQYYFEWFLGADTHALLGLHNPLFTDLQNASVGVNVLGNTSVLGLALPLIPVTLLFGATVSFALTVALGLAGTAFGWYWLFHRDLGLHRMAAILGGFCCTFAPPIVSQANAHPHLVAMFVLPWIVRFGLRLAHSTTPIRHGLWLGLLIVYQVFVGEELLLMTALALGLFVVCYAVLRRDELRTMVRPFLTGLATAAVVAGALLAYPLYMQFWGPAHYTGLGGMPEISNDLNTLTAYSTQSLGYQGAPLASWNYAEENAYFGWPLLLLALIITVWLWRDRLVRVCAIVGSAFLLCSLGTRVNLRSVDTGIPGVWRLFKPLPLLDSMVVGRFTFVTSVTLGVMLAIATHRVIGAPPQAGHGIPVRVLWAPALAGALVPLIPVPLPVVMREPVPQFFADGTYRGYVEPDHTIVPVPPATPGDGRALRWQVSADMAFKVPGGYFLGPLSPDGHFGYSPPASVTTSVIQQVRSAGQPVPLTDAQRAAILADLRRWRADAVVAFNEPALAALRATLDPLLGPAQPVSDVWLWDVRTLTRS